MFERYTERARRVLFFARWEVSTRGGTAIEPEHVLLGLLRESKGSLDHLFAHHDIPLSELRQHLEGQAKGSQRVSESVEIPFAMASKRVLNYAAQEADRLRHATIEPEHLLLALLHEDDGVAAASLRSHGLDLERAREYVATHPPGSATIDREGFDPSQARHLHMSLGLDRISVLMNDLANAQPGSQQTHDLVTQIQEQLVDLRMMLQI